MIKGRGGSEMGSECWPSEQGGVEERCEKDKEEGSDFAGWEGCLT